MTSTAAPAKASATKAICALSSSEFSMHFCRCRANSGNTVELVVKHSRLGKVFLPTHGLAGQKHLEGKPLLDIMKLQEIDFKYRKK